MLALRPNLSPSLHNLKPIFKFTVNGKSIMGVMMLAAGKGTEIKVNAEGDDAELALQAIDTLINTYFGEGE